MKKRKFFISMKSPSFKIDRKFHIEVKKVGQ